MRDFGSFFTHTLTAYAAVISSDSGEETIEAGDEATLRENVREYLGQQVENGGMTDTDAAKVLEDLQNAQ